MSTDAYCCNPCPACQGEGRIVIEGPDHEGRDGNCWRSIEYREEPCQLCGGSGFEGALRA